MFEAIDLYCERLGAGFWAEPVNALTNLFFLGAAWLAWRRARRLKAGSPGVWLLVGLLFSIGVGSFLFHTFATRWAELADVLPIMLFQFTYVWLYCREVADINITGTMSILLVYFAASMFAGRFPDAMNGSLGYAPSLVVLLGLGVYHAVTRRKERLVLMIAAGVFLVSLTFRTMDNAICPCFPLGTHFLWHICNATMLYLVLHGFLANRSIRIR